jgi:hypothetical protein
VACCARGPVGPNARPPTWPDSMRSATLSRIGDELLPFGVLPVRLIGPGPERLVSCRLLFTGSNGLKIIEQRFRTKRLDNANDRCDGSNRRRKPNDSWRARAHSKSLSRWASSATGSSPPSVENPRFPLCGRGRASLLNKASPILSKDGRHAVLVNLTIPLLHLCLRRFVGRGRSREGNWLSRPDTKSGLCR